MFTTLYSKLAAVLLGLFVLIGAGTVYGTLHFLTLYGLESNQRLNRTLAQHLADQSGILEERDVDVNRLRRMFDMQMIVNPSIQIYLLDTGGRVTGWSGGAEERIAERVSLDPIRGFLAPNPVFPILGDDPRAPGRGRIFSVAPIPVRGAAAGYLYVVLAGESQQMSSVLKQSYVIQLAASVAVASLLLALLAGLGFFALITRKLTRLAQGMHRFQAGDFSDGALLPPLPEGKAGDEIDRLGLAFRGMASRIAGQMQALKQTDVLRRELVANVSHDLKTPLASVQGYVDTLLLKDDVLSPEERRSYLGVASRSCQRLSKLVADLIELAKLDAHEVTLHAEPFSAGELVQDVVQKFQIKAEQRRVRLETELPDRAPHVTADIGLIERVLDNLIGNALAHTASGGAVRVSLHSVDGEVVLRVSDTGCGISAEDLPHVFERFYRVNDADWGKGVNAGLGLAITKGILDLHGSQMKVESRLGEGTSFAFALPVATPDAT
jgi:signal transduction histidine kinase